MLSLIQRALALSLSATTAITASVYLPAPRPLVLWHGLGDSYNSPAMLDFVELIKTVHPGIFVHSIYLHEETDQDQRAGWFGNVNEQVESAAAQLQKIPELADGFDAMGFSQGGQFLRAFVERYNSPPVRNLITFGSQHMGIADLPGCRAGDFLCRLVRSLAKSGLYGAYAQNNLVPAQYYRNPVQLERYLEVNTFLADINGEVAATRNSTYAANLASLDNLVLVVFTRDKTVVPKESSWFSSFAPSEDGGIGAAIPMRLQPLYTNDWIGLRTLDERHAVALLACEGEHMQLNQDCWKPIVKQYVGGRELTRFVVQS